MSQMLGMAGKSVEDLMTDEEITQHLTDAFNKFDSDGSGQLGQWEFTQAWMTLGLKGSEQEISDAFKSNIY